MLVAFDAMSKPKFGEPGKPWSWIAIQAVTSILPHQVIGQSGCKQRQSGPDSHAGGLSCLHGCFGGTCNVAVYKVFS